MTCVDLVKVGMDDLSRSQVINDRIEIVGLVVLAHHNGRTPVRRDMVFTAALLTDLPLLLCGPSRVLRASNARAINRVSRPDRQRP